ncbi:hypothetical protein FIBSPDRAFT_863852 [Athelia psychrophila]|uniref:DH domain-containing protein n=1 Tax=Athelia psychrophila TaxID=1759441 RepID=A0A166H0Y5_9AGAM|nr:hypothetical protein FIBSPDRAFT_863852 [Fibularhizoctonia sp. CBS 109695]
MPSQRASEASLAALLESMALDQENTSTPSPSDSRSVLSTASIENEAAASTSSLPPAPPSMPKRAHALVELLSSERAYASDLVLIRQIHIPLALGQPEPFHLNPATPPSSNSSTRTRSTASESSTTSSTLGPPMTREDAKIIFSNITDLAIFADTFGDRLEDALGSVLDGGTGDDRVGALFLELIPAMEPLYKTYITKHAAALSHLSDLPVTPALTAYLARSRTLATNLTHAWDLPSLLIKPVQRLLKYALLLSAIIADTAETHPDKANLKLARTKMEDVARGVNEDRRRWEVVKEVLGTKPGEKGKKVPVVMQATARIRNMRSHKDRAESNQEAELVEAMELELKRSDEFINQFAKDVVAWGQTVKGTVLSLRQWATGFAQVIGLSPEQNSEAFDAFMVVIEQQLMPLGDDLQAIIKDKFLPSLALLVESMKAPLRLLEAMNTLEPLHYSLLNNNYAKGRPPPQMLEASQSYIALRGQLHSELPQYLKLLDKGIAASIMQLAHWQTAYWADVRERWGGLWEALRVEGERNAGAAETERVWWGRWEEVAAFLHGLNVVNPKKIYIEKPLRRATQEAAPASIVINMLASLNSANAPASTSPPTMRSPKSPSSVRRPSTMEGSSPKTPRRRSKDSSKSGKSRVSRHSQPVEDLSEYAYIAIPHPMPISMPKPIMSPRTKSNPIGVPRLGPRPSVSSSSSTITLPIDRHSSAPEVESHSEARGRPARRSSIRQKLSENLRPPSRSKSIEMTPPPLGTTTFYTTAHPMPAMRHSVASMSSMSKIQRERALYSCRVVHPCSPPDGVQYRKLPFFTLQVNAIFDVLREFGHPSLHPDLPLYVDDGEDCLLLVRDYVGQVGWSLASFLIPLD